MRRGLALAALLLGSGSEILAQEAVKNPDTFTYAVVGDVDSLDPDWQYDGISCLAMWQIYETLIIYKGSSVSEFEPLISEKVPSKQNGLISPDGLTYTLPIRKGVRFHDGTPLAPEDVKYSLMRFLFLDRPGGPSPLVLEPILGVDTARDKGGNLVGALYDEADKAIQVRGNDVVVRLKKPFAPFLPILASWGPVLSKSWSVAHGDWDGKKETWAEQLGHKVKEASYLYDHADGTGPFRLAFWNKREKQMVFERNEKYWRRPARLKTVILKTVDEFATRKLLIQAGDADAVLTERQYLPQLEGLEGVTVEDGLPAGEVHTVFAFNFKINAAGNPDIGSGKLDGDGIPPDFFTDIHVRRGFAAAFDYDTFIRDGFRGKGKRARGPILSALPGYNPRQPLTAYSPKAAAEEFKKAWGGRVWDKGFRFTISYQEGWADRRLACEMMKRGIEALNPKFRVDVRGILWSTFLADMNAARLPMANLRWNIDYADAHNCVEPFLQSQGAWAGLMGYSNPVVDRLIGEAVGELDPAKRKALYYKIQKIAHDDLPAIFTVEAYDVRVHRSWVKNWAYCPPMEYGYLYPVYKSAAQAPGRPRKNA